MLGVGQKVITRYGPGQVVSVSRVNSNIYVRVPARAGTLYIFCQDDVRPIEPAGADEVGGPDQRGLAGGEDGFSPCGGATGD